VNITAEVTIDIDDKRRVWATVNADVEPELFNQVAIAAADSAVRLYEESVGRQQRKEDEADKLRTFRDN
jgi:hypothetical protein